MKTLKDKNKILNALDVFIHWIIQDSLKISIKVEHCRNNGGWASALGGCASIEQLLSHCVVH